MKNITHVIAYTHSLPIPFDLPPDIRKLVKFHSGIFFPIPFGVGACDPAAYLRDTSGKVTGAKL